MTTAAKREARALHRLLRERFPKAFPREHAQIRPLKIDIYEDIVDRLGNEVDRELLKRVLANHTGRACYHLAILHRRGDHRYDLDGKPAGVVDDTARAEAAKQIAAIQERQKAQSEKYQTHKKRERELQDAKAKRRAEREQRAAEKQRRREEHERNRQRKLEREQQQRQPPQRPYRRDQPALLQPRDPSQTPPVVYKKRRRIVPKDRKD